MPVRRPGQRRKREILLAKKEVNGVEVNGKSIITALKIIKQVCEDNIEESCVNCPMFINSECCCGVTDLEPHNWKILEYEKFQAFG